MLSINNFFGIDLEKMPNHKSQYEKSDINIQGINYKEYSHKISPNCENYFFHSLSIIVFEDGGSNLIFDRIPYDRENAVDIAFIIERDLFNNGSLDYVSYFRKHKKEFNDIYFRFEWKLEMVTINFERWDDELSITVYSKYHYDRDSEEIIPDSITAEDGIVEYTFGSDFYPQGCEILPGEKDYQEPLPIEKYTFRTIKLRVEATEERLNEYATIFRKSFMKEEINFMGMIMDGACVFVSTDTHIVLPMTQTLDRQNLLGGHNVFAYMRKTDTSNMDVYYGYTLQVITDKEQKENGLPDIPKEVVFENYEIPSYVYDLIEQYKPKTQVESTDEIQEVANVSSKAKAKTISISFNEYDLSSANLKYLKSCADDNSIEFKLSLKTDKRKREYISVESINSDYPLSTEIKDECFIEDFKRHEQWMKEGKTEERCYGVLYHYQNANSEFSTSQRIFFHIKIYMPWTLYKEIPGVLEDPQETPSLETDNEGKQEYIATLVGFKFCLKEDELEDVDKYFYKFDNIIRLKPEFDNPFDSNAIAAFIDNGKKIAYVAKENAQMIRPLMKDGEELIAKPERFDFTSATIRLSLPCNKSLEMESLFSRYQPIEVYKAHYLNVFWGGCDSLIERKIFNEREQSINFEELTSLPIDRQNYLAEEWKENMHKVSVENPTNLGLKMNVHLDLSIYNTNLADIDLFDVALLDKIEEDNKKTALFVRLMRERLISNPTEFIEEHCPDACDTLKQRLQFEYNKIRK